MTVWDIHYRFTRDVRPFGAAIDAEGNVHMLSADTRRTVRARIDGRRPEEVVAERTGQPVDAIVVDVVNPATF